MKEDDSIYLLMVNYTNYKQVPQFDEFTRLVIFELMNYSSICPFALAYPNQHCTDGGARA